MIRISGQQVIQESEPDYNDVENLVFFTLTDSKGEQVIKAEDGRDRSDIRWCLKSLQYTCDEINEEIYIEEEQLRYISFGLDRGKTERMELFLEYEYPRHFEILHIIKNEEYIDKKTFVFQDFRQYRYKSDDFIVNFSSTLLKNVTFSIMYNRKTKELHRCKIRVLKSEILFILYDYPMKHHFEAWHEGDSRYWIHEDFVSFAKPIVWMKSLFMEGDLDESEFW